MASRFALVIISYRTKLFHFSVLPRHPDGLAPIQRSKSNFSYPISFLLLTLECCLSAFIIVCRRGMRRKSWDLKYLKASVQPLEPLLSSSFCCVDLCTNILFHRLFCRCHLFESYASWHSGRRLFLHARSHFTEARKKNRPFSTREWLPFFRSFFHLCVLRRRIVGDSCEDTCIPLVEMQYNILYDSVAFPYSSSADAT